MFLAFLFIISVWWCVVTCHIFCIVVDGVLIVCVCVRERKREREITKVSSWRFVDARVCDNDDGGGSGGGDDDDNDNNNNNNNRRMQLPWG